MKSLPTKRAKFFAVVFALYTVLAAVLFFSPRVPVPNIPEEIAPDKIAHVVLHIIFSYLFFKMRDAQNIRKKDILLELFFLGIMVSVFTEEIQGFIPGREKSWLDTLANLIGFFSFITFSAFVNRGVAKQK